jgi:serine/threonine protein kinase
LTRIIYFFAYFITLKIFIDYLIFKILDSNGNYFSVLEYANEGNLRDYLKTKFSTLKWNDKLQMALDITRGLMCLHSEKVIHGNLVNKFLNF